MNTLMLNTISAASINGLQVAKNSLLNSNFYSGVSFFNQDEKGTVSNIRSEGLIYGSYQASFSWFEPKWQAVNDIYNESPIDTLFVDKSEENQKTSDVKNVELRDKIIKLQGELGNDLFDQLSYKHILLLINTAGIIKVGPVNINKIYDVVEG